MSFSKYDLDTIKSKIQLSTEIEKKVKIIKKGNDYWCCCPFHNEKTPSCKINDDQGTYYCFGCGARGDIFTIYTDLYNYSFPDAVKELAQRVGINITDANFKKGINKDDKIFEIIDLATDWYQDNFLSNIDCQKYLEKRQISQNTSKEFRIGYSYNPKSSLYQYLKNKNFKDEDILKSNLVKIDKNNKYRDFFYKRLMFPIANEQNRVVGFGGRVLDNSNPKYINSPESYFFKKRSLLYNLNKAKKNIRSKKNVLICEGYMDVISLFERNIKTAVAPLGTALTETQLFLSWKYVDMPTIMFDGDNAGLMASYKSAIMALPHLSPNKYLQFIKLPSNHDPDSYIAKHSIKQFAEILKKPESIVNFIFNQSSSSVDFTRADKKISFDKYIDDLVLTIKDKKVQYFYKNEFKKLFFDKLKSLNKKKSLEIKNKYNHEPLIEKQINSFLLSYINHSKIRDNLAALFHEVELFNDNQEKFINYLYKSDLNFQNIEEISKLKLPEEASNMLKKLQENTYFQLFPYSHKDYDSEKTLEEITESAKNLNTRLSNLKKINKSLNEFDDDFSSLTWDDLKSISFEFTGNKE